MPRAFVTGITGQDGQHLAEFLHGKGYEVFGLVKGQNNPRLVQLREEFPYVQPVPGDLADLPSLEVLRAKLLGSLKAPAQKLVAVINTPGSQLARVIKAKADKPA